MRLDEQVIRVVRSGAGTAAEKRKHAADSDCGDGGGRSHGSRWTAPPSAQKRELRRAH